MAKRYVSYQGETKSVSEWARELGVNVSTLRYRLRVMPIDEAFSRSGGRSDGTSGSEDLCCYPDCYSCPYPDCITDEIHPGELTQNAEWSGLPQLLLSDRILRMGNPNRMGDRKHGNNDGNKSG